MGHKQHKQLSNLFHKWGIELNGDAPWDITGYDDSFYNRVLAHGSLGLGESYMDGCWDSPKVDETLLRLIGSNASETLFSPWLYLDLLRARLFNRQSISRASIVGKRHYDVGDDLYRIMLGRTMIYTCGYWKNADTLNEAQEEKLHLVAKKLELQPGMRILDIGCGWGNAAKFFAENYDVAVVGVTISENQVAAGKLLCEGLPVDIRYQDYRELTECFDRIYSLGMFEHVGYKNYRTYMKVVKRCLKPEGLFLLHTIGTNGSKVCLDPWMERYIFPNAVLPSATQVSSAAEGLFVLEDWHNFGIDYDKTLMAWYQNINEQWGELEELYDERFHRMWNYYLLTCAASFRNRKNQLWQIVFSPEGVAGGYCSVR